MHKPMLILANDRTVVGMQEDCTESGLSHSRWVREISWIANFREKSSIALRRCVCIRARLSVVPPETPGIAGFSRCVFAAPKGGSLRRLQIGMAEAMP